jgi:hypothetical protein
MERSLCAQELLRIVRHTMYHMIMMIMCESEHSPFVRSLRFRQNFIYRLVQEVLATREICLGEAGRHCFSSSPRKGKGESMLTLNKPREITKTQTSS